MSQNEFACPNCGTIIGSEDACPISFGCILRKVMMMEYGMRKGLSMTTSVIGNTVDVPTLSEETIRELFTTASVNCTAMPPIITALRYNLQDLRKIPKFLKKETHLCSNCFDDFIDTEERSRQLKSKRIQLNKEKRLEGIPKSLIASQQRRALQAFKFDERSPDVTKDMTFTNLQSDVRQLYRCREVKENGKELVIYSRSGDISTLEGDYTAAVAREIRRTAINISRSTQNHGSDEITPLAISQRREDVHRPWPYTGVAPGTLVSHYHGSSRKHHCHPRNPSSMRGLQAASLGSDLSVPKDTVTLGQSQLVAFDVSLDQRLMSDLYEEMTNVCDFSRPCSYPIEENDQCNERIEVSDSCQRYLYNDSGSFGISKAHPLYQVYKNNMNRLPEPPVPYVCLEIPQPSIPYAGISCGDCMPSDIRCFEEYPKLDKDRKYKVTESMKIIGLEGLTDEQVHLLDDVLQDSTIALDDDNIVDEEDETEDDDDDDEEEETEGDESEEDSNGV